MVDNTIALQTHTPNIQETLTPISSMLKLKSGILDVKQKQMQWNSRKATAEVLSDPKYQDDQGQVDLMKITPALIKADPGNFYASDIVSSLAQAKSHVTNAQTAQIELAKNNWDSMSRGWGALLPRLTKPGNNDNPQVLAHEMIMDMQQQGVITPTVAGHAFDKFPSNGSRADQIAWIKDRQMSAQSAATQVAQQNAPVTMVNTGQQAVPVQTNPLSAGATNPAQPVQMQMPPTTQTVDANGNPVYVGPQGTNTPNPNPHAGNAPRGPVPAGPVIGQPEMMKGAQEHVASVRSAGDQAPIQRNINQRILQLSKDTKTGPGTAGWQNFFQGAGALIGTNVSDYQELGKYLEKNAIANMQSMGGPPSDARLNAAAEANGSTKFNPKALQDVTKFNDATNTALMKYRQGMDQAVGFQTPKFNTVPEFRANWAKNFDIDIFRVEDAIRNGDKQELDKLRSEIGPKRMKELARKRQNLESLAATGHLP